MSIIPLQTSGFLSSSDVAYRAVFDHQQTSHTAGFSIINKRHVRTAGIFVHNSISSIIIPKALSTIPSFINSYQLLSTLTNSYRTQTNPNESKQSQKNPNKSKRIQTNPNESKRIQTNPIESKMP